MIRFRKAALWQAPSRYAVLSFIATCSSA